MMGLINAIRVILKREGLSTRERILRIDTFLSIQTVHTTVDGSSRKSQQHGQRRQIGKSPLPRDQCIIYHICPFVSVSFFPVISQTRQPFKTLSLARLTIANCTENASVQSPLDNAGPFPEYVRLLPGQMQQVESTQSEYGYERSA